MPINFEKTPETWQKAVLAVCSNLSTEELKELREHGYCAFHPSVGRQIRNEWGLWDSKSPLHKSFKEEFGLTHADDMSGILLQAAHALASGKDMEFHKWAEEYLAYWEMMKTK